MGSTGGCESPGRRPSGTGRGGSGGCRRHRRRAPGRPSSCCRTALSNAELGLLELAPDGIARHAQRRGDLPNAAPLTGQYPELHCLLLGQHEQPRQGRDVSPGGSVLHRPWHMQLHTFLSIFMPVMMAIQLRLFTYITAFSMFHPTHH